MTSVLGGRWRSWAEPPDTATGRSGLTPGLQGDLWGETLPHLWVTTQLLLCLSMSLEGW